MKTTKENKGEKQIPLQNLGLELNDKIYKEKMTEVLRFLESDINDAFISKLTESEINVMLLDFKMIQEILKKHLMDLPSKNNNF